MKTILWTIYGVMTGILWLIAYVFEAIFIMVADIFGEMKEYFNKKGDLK